MEGTDWAFNHGTRRSQDRGWFFAYVASVMIALIAGVVAWRNMNPLFTKAISDEGFMSNPNSCEPGAPGRRLQSTDEFDVENFGEVAGIWIVVSAVLALLGGLLVVYLFRKLPRVMVILGVSIPVLLLAVMAVIIKDPIFALVNGAGALLTLGFMFIYRKQIKQVARMMKIAADSLAANPGLLPFAVGTNIVVLIPALGFAAALYFLQGNGEVVPDPSVERHTMFAPLLSGACVDGRGRSVACCMWQPAPWVPPVQMAVLVILMWTMAVRSQLRTYVIGGVVTQWYFFSETRGTTLQSVGHALGPARGTLCFSGAIITLCDIIRYLAENLRTEQADNTLALIVSCICSYILDLLQELIRFVSNLATIQAAATGEAFLSAARGVGEMLTRHSMSAVAVWWLPNVVLQYTTLGIAAVAGVLTYYASNATWQHSNRHQAHMDAIALGVIVGLIWAAVLGWVAGFIKSATEVVYVCFARDLDNRTVTRPDVHDVLKDVPAASGAVVVQPDNNLVYGAMEEGREGSAADPLLPPAATPPPGYPGSASHAHRDLTSVIEGESPDEHHNGKE